MKQNRVRNLIISNFVRGKGVLRDIFQQMGIESVIFSVFEDVNRKWAILSAEGARAALQGEEL